MTHEQTMNFFGRRNLLSKQANPLQVIVSNDTNEVKNIKLFGSSFNDFDNEHVIPSQTEVSYSFIQKSLLNTSYEIGLIRLQSSAKNKKNEYDRKISIQNLKKLVILLMSKNPNGQLIQIPIETGKYIDPKQVYKDMVDCDFRLKLDGSTELSLNVPAKSQFVITLFPESITDIHGKKYYSLGYINAVRDIKHPFGAALFDKIMEAENLKKELKGHPKNVYKISFVSVEGSEYAFNSEIDAMLISLHDIHCDLYRNMVNLYVLFDRYIVGLKKSIENTKLQEEQVKKQKKSDALVTRKLEKKLKNKYPKFKKSKPVKKTSKNK